LASVIIESTYKSLLAEETNEKKLFLQ